MVNQNKYNKNENAFGLIQYHQCCSNKKLLKT